jgi:2-oxo-3-hexenedioate decarboxylase
MPRRAEFRLGANAFPPAATGRGIASADPMLAGGRAMTRPSLDTATLAGIAGEALAALDARQQVTPFSARIDGFRLADAYRVATDVRARRVARGERPLGRKIGFTNRTIWAEYDVWAPIWGTVYDSTVQRLPGPDARFSLDHMIEPRIEPEIVFGLAHAPQAGMDEADLLGCIDWIAHGFEIVQSIYPGWKFTAADTVAAFGLHGALLIGRPCSVGNDRSAWRAALSGFEITLSCDGEEADRGQAANVLGGPLSALRHLVELLAQDAAQPPLAAGELVTTGTLTRALPISRGQRWQTALEGVALPGLDVSFD